MKALTYHGPKRRSWEEHPKPVLRESTDVIVRMTTTTICGTDLHILKGDVPTVRAGRILGHEGVGIIHEVGSAITSLQRGDRVLISCITSCGKCSYCSKQMYSHCKVGGWLLGNSIDGTQAEYVRIPYAETSLHVIPREVDDEAATMLSDVLPTGYECGVHNGQVKPGDFVAIVGAGAIGLAAVLTAGLYAPAAIAVIDLDPIRLALAKTLGATHQLNNTDGTAVARIMELTNGVGVDVAIEAVGLPSSFDLCQSIIAPGGHIANVGVHGCAVELHLEKLWKENITLTTGLVDTSSTPMLLKMVQSGRLSTKQFVSHRLALAEIMTAYDIFENAGKQNAVKIALTSSSKNAA